MKESSGQWVIRIQSDQVKGPYSTDAVIKMIITGAFSGNEEISAYPEGDWQDLTKQPEFYDALLESLENPVEVDIKKAQKMEAETVIRVVEPVKKETAPEDIPLPTIQNLDDLKAFVEGENKLEEYRKHNKDRSRDLVAGAPHENPAVLYQNQITAQQKAAANSFMSDRDKNLEIQMVDIQKLKQNELKKLFPIFFILILALGAIVYYFLPSDSESASLGVALMSPKKNFETITPEDIKKYKSNAVKAFQSGIIEQILAAQPGLVSVVENSPRDIESMALLCMAYEQLWPYTKQTEDDLRSITTVTQAIRNANGVSAYAQSCQAIFLLTKGQAKEARSNIEKTLDNPTDEKFSLSPFLYLIKAEILESDSDFINAGAYYEQAVKLWPQWTTARFGLGRMYYKQSKFAEALEQYQSIYSVNKDSKAALFGLGLVEIKGSKNLEKALSYFSSGYEIKQRLPKDFLTEALIAYTKILIDKSDAQKALAVAKKAYQTSPSNREARELVLSLGGDDKLENAQSELMLAGDHFVTMGDHMAAQAQYKACYEFDSKSGICAFKAAKSLWQINQTRDAITWLEKSIAADPNMIQSYILKSDYESQKYNFIGAMKALQEASRRFPKSQELTKAQAILEFRKNNMMGAIQFGERAIKFYSADVELLTVLAKAYIYFYLNAPATKKEDLAKKEKAKELAERYSGKAVDLEPAWPEAEITRAKALAAFSGGVRAEVFLKEFIKNYPYTMEYRIALAELYTSNEKYLDAVGIYEEVVSIDPKNKKANFQLAETYRVLNKVEQAQTYYNATSLLDPSDMEPMFANAKLLIETASGKQERAQLEQALGKLTIVKTINPDFPKVSYLMAKCYLELGDYKKAGELIREEKTKNPNIADSYILAAEVFYRQNQFKDCATEYSSAIKMRPSKADLYIRASVCYRNSGAVDIAQDMVDMAFDRESGNAENFREQGYISKQRGEKARAVMCLERYLEYSPNAVDKSTVQNEIKEIGVSANGDCRAAKSNN